MKKIIITGLGNPGVGYENTRHNAGRIILDLFRESVRFPGWIVDQKSKALVSSGRIGKRTVVLVAPDNFMNNSGKSISQFVKNEKEAEQLVVIYDDLDLPIGKIKVTYNRGHGGHRGVESIVNSLKTKKFARIRVGISPTTLSGEIKKPKGERRVLDFLMGEFTADERRILDKVAQQVFCAIDTILSDGVQKAMNLYN